MQVETASPAWVLCPSSCPSITAQAAADTEPFINCQSCSEYCTCIKTLYLHHSLVNCEVGPIIIRKLGV